MKTKLISRIMVALTAMALTLSATSCGLGKLADILDPDNYETGWTEEGNKLTYKQELGVATYLLEFTFNASGELVSAKETAKWATAALAQEYYNELKEDGEQDVTISGSTVTRDVTDEYSGISKDELKEVIENSYL